MDKCALVIFLILLTLTACGSGGSGSDPEGALYSIIEGAPDIQSLQVGQGQVLPPYGLKVIARTAALRLRFSTSQKEAADRRQEIQTAIDRVTALTGADLDVSLERISVQKVGGSYYRESSADDIQNLDTGSIVMVLTTELAGDAPNLMDAVATFDAFLQDLTLPETLSVQAVSIEAELGDLEPYRGQIIARVYAELDAVQQQYGPEVKYEVTGLYEGLKVIPLSDVEYYIYLEPVVVVSEF
ncbi:MAG: hypothetical protein PVF47_10595 [Anaerolineae bacterium]|jgi:hypothetical protein